MPNSITKKLFFKYFIESLKIETVLNINKNTKVHLFKYCTTLGTYDVDNIYHSGV